MYAMDLNNSVIKRLWCTGNMDRQESSWCDVLGIDNYTTTLDKIPTSFPSFYQETLLFIIAPDKAHFSTEK